MRDALDLLSKKLAKVISNLSAFALKWKGKSWQRLLEHEAAFANNNQPNPRLHTPTFKQRS